MSKNETCFIYNDEIYYRIDVTEKQIDDGLKYMVDETIYEEPDHAYQAQMYLIDRQVKLIMRKHCE